jgi:peptidoglycan/xylan/chitin deacetylase (PgdA/CDA1 family)
VYHRVREAAVDPFGMSVAPSRFTEHLRVLRALRRPLLSLADFARGHCDGTLPSGAIAITVDDGYADAVDAARLLAEHDIPATFFVTSGAIGADGMWWDHAAEALLSARDVEPFDVVVGGQRYVVEPGPPIDPAVHREWRISTTPHPTTRHAALYRVWMLLLCATADERAAAVRALDAATIDPVPRGRSMLDADEIAKLAVDSRARIGSHTASHLSLVRTEHRARPAELDTARRVLAELAGHEIDAIAYPHGHVDSDIAALARRTGHTVGVARGNTRVDRDADRWRLPRVEVGNWTGADFERRLASRG